MVDSAVNGQVAYDLVAKTQYDCVLMDCQMPVMDGFESTRKIRALENERGGVQVRIVALTASTTTQEIEKMKNAGMVRCPAHALSWPMPMIPHPAHVFFVNVLY